MRDNESNSSNLTATVSSIAVFKVVYAVRIANVFYLGS